MSHDVKYIGMDVHKEATVIVVLNESGKQASVSPRLAVWSERRIHESGRAYLSGIQGSKGSVH